MEPLAAIALGVFLWWFGTGAVLLAVRPGVRGPGVLAACVLGLIALWAFAWGAGGDTVGHAVASFAAGIAVWGWHEWAFLSGWLTGPNHAPCPPGATGWPRFRAAFWTLAWHHLALVATVLALLILSDGAAQRIGLWTFLLLFAARISAQLNVFLGVSNLSTDFVPAHLAHLTSYFRQARMNPLFPVSVTALALTTACFAERATAAPDPGGTAGFTLLATLAALALLEHWLMVLPVRDALLWRWLLPSSDARRGPKPAPDRA